MKKLALALVVLLAGCASDVAADVAAPAVTVTSGTMGAAVTQDGTFEYTVTSLKCDPAAIKGETPKGTFCTVGLTVHNLTIAARKPGISFAKAYDSAGTAYLADALAQIQSGSLLLDDLAGGATIDDHLIYDVPKTATLTKIVLSESTTSTGISIPLS
ncbi:uncharacterized protein YceK [Actinoplanes tereljensis]|uniref:DUF4352 domain-containing protein n=1 Tax=Paractinoplanes tereljensis TaxID=571912 RepID=A0A919NN04_9ACTN|nr:DUF4352 domain-containing protein [Actinoplanes tereljensis]GIF21826.1 hypothetical protein Ate02nite_45560 [Actinoplanes tereljensis]